MGIIKIVRRNIMFKPLQSLIACLVVAAGIAMAVLVLLLADGVHSGLSSAAEPFPIVAGTKGSPNQLVLNTVFLKDTPMSNISYAEVEKLRANKNVGMAVPFGYGDNYRGFRMAGTEKEIFDYVINPQRGKWLQIAEGRAFEAPFEAVLGANLKWVAVGSLVAYIVCFAFSLGPIGWVLVSEVFPLKIRGLAMSICTVSNFAFNFFVVGSFPILINRLGGAITFWGFAAVSFLCILFVFFFVPETKGISLEQIESNWLKGVKPRDF